MKKSLAKATNNEKSQQSEKSPPGAKNSSSTKPRQRSRIRSKECKNRRSPKSSGNRHISSIQSHGSHPAYKLSSNTKDDDNRPRQRRSYPRESSYYGDNVAVKDYTPCSSSTRSNNKEPHFPIPSTKTDDTDHANVKPNYIKKKEKKRTTKKAMNPQLQVLEMECADVNGNHCHCSEAVNSNSLPHSNDTIVYSNEMSIAGV